MGLVEYHRVRRAENVAEAVLLEREVCQQQVMGDNDNVGVESLAARDYNMATGKLRTACSKTVFAC